MLNSLRRKHAPLLILLAAALLAASCQKQRSHPKPQPNPQPVKTSATLRLYFHDNASPDAPPVAVGRSIRIPGEAGPDVLARKVFTELLAGPSQAEKDKGLYSSLPEGTKLLGLRYARPYVYLNFSTAMEQTGGSAKVRAILEQIAFTSASIPGIKAAILEIGGEQAGTNDHPFTGEGFLFDSLRPPVDGPWAEKLTPADTLDLFVTVIPDPDEMWKMMGPAARRQFESPDGIDVSGFAEGLGAWRSYRIIRQEINGDQAVVEIGGHQVLEGNVEPKALYKARMVREEGRWKWELPDS